MGGSVCVYGVISDASITVNKGAGPYNFNLYMHQWPTRHRERAAQAPLCEWIRRGKLDAAEFVTHRFPLAQVNEALEVARSGKAVKVLLQY